MDVFTPQYGPREDMDDAGSQGRLLARCKTCEGIHSDPLARVKPAPRRRLILIHAGAILCYGLMELLVLLYLNTRQGQRQSMIYCKTVARSILILFLDANGKKSSGQCNH